MKDNVKFRSNLCRVRLRSLPFLSSMLFPLSKAFLSPRLFPIFGNRQLLLGVSSASSASLPRILRTDFPLVHVFSMSSPWKSKPFIESNWWRVGEQRRTPDSKRGWNKEINDECWHSVGMCWPCRHSPNGFSYRGPYFKYRGEGSQILIRFFLGCRAGGRPRCRLMCVWVSGLSSEGSQILIRRFGGGCRAGGCARCRLMWALADFDLFWWGGG